MGKGYAGCSEAPCPSSSTSALGPSTGRGFFDLGAPKKASIVRFLDMFQVSVLRERARVRQGLGVSKPFTCEGSVGNASQWDGEVPTDLFYLCRYHVMIQTGRWFPQRWYAWDEVKRNRVTILSWTALMGVDPFHGCIMTSPRAS